MSAVWQMFPKKATNVCWRNIGVTTVNAPMITASTPMVLAMRGCDGSTLNQTVHRIRAVSDQTAR